jgi:hypothetical protein
MASWLLNCRNCGEAFAYSLVPDTPTDYYLPSPQRFHCKVGNASVPTAKPSLVTARSI